MPAKLREQERYENPRVEARIIVAAFGLRGALRNGPRPSLTFRAPRSQIARRFKIGGLWLVVVLLLAGCRPTPDVETQKAAPTPKGDAGPSEGMPLGDASRSSEAAKAAKPAGAQVLPAASEPQTQKSQTQKSQMQKSQTQKSQTQKSQTQKSQVQAPSARSAKRRHPLVGRRLPPFALADLQGRTIDNGTLRGKVALIDFWATWCVPCRKLAPVLQRLHERHQKSGLWVIGANTAERTPAGRPRQDKQPAQAYAKQHGYTYTFAPAAGEFQRTCRVDELPTVLLINRLGVVAEVFVGWDSQLERRLTRRVESLLAEDAPQ